MFPVKYDNADNKRPGFKFADHELKGVPVRLVMGARDLEKQYHGGNVEIHSKKETVSCDGIEDLRKEFVGRNSG